MEFFIDFASRRVVSCWFCPASVGRKLHGFERRSNALVGDVAAGGRSAVPSCRGTAFQPGQSDERIPVAAPAAPSGPCRGLLRTGSADIGDDDAFLELQRFLEFDDRLLHFLISRTACSMCCLRRKRFAMIL